MMCAEDHIDSGGSPRGIPPHASEPPLSFFSEFIDESAMAPEPAARLRNVHD
jgi:hypothetical protein